MSVVLDVGTALFWWEPPGSIALSAGSYSEAAMLHPPPPTEPTRNPSGKSDVPWISRAIVLAFGWGWSVAAFFPSTNATWSFEWQLVLLPTGLLIAPCWIAWRDFTSWRFTFAWASVPLLAACVVALSVTHLGLIVRIRLCEDELRAFAEAARAGKEGTGANGPHDCRVGLFHIERTSGFGTDVSMVTARTFGDSWGITYWPEKPPEQGTSRVHLFGPWYRYHDDW
jgi:hypothetical protein